LAGTFLVRADVEQREVSGFDEACVTGLLVDSTDDLTVGTDIRFRFDLPESGEVRGRGRVVRRAPRSQLFGIEFEDMEGDGVARIQAFVDSSSTVSQAL
jgi:hypothetical protein